MEHRGVYTDDQDILREIFKTKNRVALSFTRTGNAWDNYGGVYGSGVPRFLDGGYLSEESVTNLLTANMGDCGDTSGYATGLGTPTGGSLSVPLGTGINGSRSCQLIANSTGQIFTNLDRITGITAGSNYTAYGLVKSGDGGVCGVRLYWYDSGDTLLGGVINEVVTNNQTVYNPVYSNGVAYTGATKCQVMLRKASGVTNGVTNYDNLALIQKAYPLQWLPGGQTKQPDKLNAPVSGISNTQGTVEIMMYYDGVPRSPPQLGNLWSAGTGSQVANQLYCDYNGGTGEFRFIVYDNSGGYKLKSITQALSTGWHWITCKWTSGGVPDIFLDGVKGSTSSGGGTGICGSLGALGVGYSVYDQGRQLGYRLKNMVVHPTPLSDGVITSRQLDSRGFQLIGETLLCAPLQRDMRAYKVPAGV